MATRTARRLPGFRFEVQAPPTRETLPRMDIAVFVGFTACGPLHTPVLVEEMAHFTAIFGAEAVLAWDPQHGSAVTAYLAPTVQAFFRNGGQRCWVIRVAGEAARANLFPIPGLLQARFDALTGAIDMTPALAQARSEGSWSDSLRLGATLRTRPVVVVQLLPDGQGADLVLPTSTDIAVGDLLRLTLPEDGYVLLLAVAAVLPVTSESLGSPPTRGAVRVTGHRALWFSTRLHPPVAPAPAQAYLFSGAAAEPGAPIPVLHAPDWATLATDTPFSLTLALAPEAAPLPGSLLRVEVGAQQLWFLVQELGSMATPGSPPEPGVILRGEGLWVAPPPPQGNLTALARGDILTVDLWARQGSADATPFRDLGCTPQHARFWAALPTDVELYTDAAARAQIGRAALAFDSERVEFGQFQTSTRFPLAGGDSAADLYVPLGMTLVPEHYLGPLPLPDTALERDGLAQFGAHLFVDPDLIGTGTTALLGQADFLQYLSLRPRRLRGIHAALAIEEATLIAVPDAVHRPWFLSRPEAPPQAEESAPLPRPEWWHFLACNPPAAIPLVRQPQWGNFLDCTTRVLPIPTLSVAGEPDPMGTFTLVWTAALAGARYILEEARQANFRDAVSLYSGPQYHLTLYGRSPGTYYYRLRAEAAGGTSDWSSGLGVHVAAAPRWQLHAVQAYSPDTLLAVQRVLMRLCAARGDLLAVLGLPEHYHTAEAIAHVETLKAADAPPVLVGSAAVLPLSLGEAETFRYATIYHPWMVSQQDTVAQSFHAIPPDGAACGVLAQRALTRGAWIAPANEVWRGVVALTPRLSRSHWLALQEAQINLVRQEPRGFMVLSADTLSADPDLRPINVRRLLILLRRLSLRLGATYVFEPHDDTFRRMVQRGFEVLLDDLFVRGAFAGATPATSFQVVTSQTLNPPQSTEQGRLIVELRVAPSLPLTFLTVRLVQTGDRTLLTEGR